MKKILATIVIGCVSVGLLSGCTDSTSKQLEAETNEIFQAIVNMDVEYLDTYKDLFTDEQMKTTHYDLFMKDHNIDALADDENANVLLEHYLELFTYEIDTIDDELLSARVKVTHLDTDTFNPLDFMGYDTVDETIILTFVEDGQDGYRLKVVNDDLYNLFTYGNYTYDKKYNDYLEEKGQ